MNMKHLHKEIEFDSFSGVMRCETGRLMIDIENAAKIKARILAAELTLTGLGTTDFSSDDSSRDDWRVCRWR